MFKLIKVDIWKMRFYEQILNKKTIWIGLTFLRWMQKVDEKKETSISNLKHTLKKLLSNIL